METPDYGASGPFDVTVATIPSPLFLGRNVSVYLPQGTTEPVPTLFFSHGFDGEFPVFYDGLLNHLASRGYAAVFSPYTSLGVDQTLRYSQLFAGFNAAVTNFSTQLDPSRVGFIGHSFGGGANPWLAQRGLVQEGWGSEGAFIYSLAPWYSYLVDQQTLDAFPSQVNMVMQVFDDDRVNDHRMAIDVFDSINIAPDSKDYVTLFSDSNGATTLTADHLVPLGATGSAQVNALDTAGIYRLIDALADYTFTGSQAGKDVALGGGSAAQVDMGLWPDGTPIAPLASTDHPVAQYAPNSFVFPFDSPFNPRGLGVPLETHWTSPSGGNWDELNNWSPNQTSRAVTAVHIDPVGGLTVVGPAAEATVASLSVGAQSTGTAVLQLQNSGTLHVNGSTTIQPRGKLQGSGTLNAVGGLTNLGQIELDNGLQLSGGMLLNGGLLTGDGEIGNPLANANAGEVRITSGDRLHFTGTGNANDGQINLLGGTLDVDHDLSNLAAGRIAGHGAVIVDALLNQGEIALTGTSDVLGNLTNDTGGRVVVSGGSTATFYDDVVHQGQEIRVSPGSTAVFLGHVSGRGSYPGGGAIHFEGTFSPGNSPGSIALSTDVAFSPASVLEIELGGYVAGDEFDHLQITRHAELDGSLSIKLIDGFRPQVGDSFEFLAAESINGHFSELLDPSPARVWQVSYAADRVVLTVLAVPEPSTGLLAALGVGLLWLASRRRRSSIAPCRD